MHILRKEIYCTISYILMFFCYLYKWNLVQWYAIKFFIAHWYEENPCHSSTNLPFLNYVLVLPDDAQAHQIVLEAVLNSLYFCDQTCRAYSFLLLASLLVSQGHTSLLLTMIHLMRLQSRWGYPLGAVICHLSMWVEIYTHFINCMHY